MRALCKGRLPIWALYERARSLGLAVQVSAQSWPGLAADEDERYRIAATAEGGIWLLRTRTPIPSPGWPGRGDMLDSTRRLVAAPPGTAGQWGARWMAPWMAQWSGEGSSQVRQMPVGRPGPGCGALGVGQAAYVHQGGVTYVQVKRLVAAPAALARVPVAAAPARAGGTHGAGGMREAGGGQAGTGDTIPLAAADSARAGRPLADAGTFLDEAFGSGGAMSIDPVLRPRAADPARSDPRERSPGGVAPGGRRHPSRPRRRR